MADPITFIFEILMQIIWMIIRYVIPALFIIGFFYILYQWKFAKQVKDTLKEEYKKNVDIAKLHKPSWMLKVYMIDLPTQHEILEKMKDKEDKEKLYKAISNVRGIPLGDIIGYQCLDNLGDNLDDALRLKIITKEDYDKIKKLYGNNSGLWGTKLHHIVYKVKSGWTGGTESSILCFDDQIAGIQSDTGKVTVFGSGTRKLGYYEVLTGYSDRISTILTHIAVGSKIETMMSLESATAQMVAKAIDLDSAQRKQLQILGAQKTESPQK